MIAAVTPNVALFILVTVSHVYATLRQIRISNRIAKVGRLIFEEPEVCFFAF